MVPHRKTFPDCLSGFASKRLRDRCKVWNPTMTVSPPPNTPTVTARDLNSRLVSSIVPNIHQFRRARSWMRRPSSLVTILLLLLPAQFPTGKDKNIAETGNDAKTEKQKCQPGSGSEPAVEVIPHKQSDKGRCHQGNADPGEKSDGFDQLLFIFRHICQRSGPGVAPCLRGSLMGH